MSPSCESKTLKPKCHSAGCLCAVWIRCILAFSKDRYCQCNRFQISVELTVTVRNYEAGLVPGSDWLDRVYVSIQILYFALSCISG